MTSPLGLFFRQYYARKPVNATFTGFHAYDALLPDWSFAARDDADRERGALREGIVAEAQDTSARLMARAQDASLDLALLVTRAEAGLLDAALAHADLDVRDAERASGHFVERNPSLWVGEAVFGAASLMLRAWAPRDIRLESLASRLNAVPLFLRTMRSALGERVPSRWIARAQRECRAAGVLFGAGLESWLALEDGAPALVANVRAGAASAREAFHEADVWLGSLQYSSTDQCACGAGLFATLLRRGHLDERSADALLAAAVAAMGPAKERHAELLSEAGPDRVPGDAGYMGEFVRTWRACRAVAAEHDLVTWPDWPVDYVPFPEWAAAAAQDLYWLFYRSPSPFDTYSRHDYFVRPGWSSSAIKLNHVVHHGGLGHHVQNWHAMHRSRTRIGAISAIDCATRIGMFCGGSLAEGWACYAADLMDECGFLNPFERASQQQGRVRMLARAIVDIRLHHGEFTAAEAADYYVNEAGMSRDAAEGEVTKNSMFPCTAIMYWLGSQGILDLRASRKSALGSTFYLRAFHDELLSYGAIPVALIARIMNGVAA